MTLHVHRSRNISVVHIGSSRGVGWVGIGGIGSISGMQGECYRRGPIFSLKPLKGAE